MTLPLVKRTEAVTEIQIPFGDRVFRAFLVELTGSRVLVDTGVAETAGEFVDSVRPLQPELLVITHAHRDHVGGLLAFKEAFPEVPVVCHTDEELPVAPDRLVEDGDEVVPGLLVIHVPGHTPGNIALLLEDEKTLLAGDCIFGAGSPAGGKLSAPPSHFSRNPAEANANVVLLLDHDFDRAILSHGEHLLQGARGEVRMLVESLRNS